MLEIFVRLQSLMTVQREKGATAVEYGLFVALIAAIIVAGVAALGTEVSDAFDDVVKAIKGETTTGG